MLKLYELLSGIIEPMVPCFVGGYPTKKEKIYPYAEIKFPNILPNNSYSDINLLEVDIWNNKDTDIREIEGIADLIHAELNRYHYIDDYMQVSINRNNPYRLELLDPQIGIQRRQLRYTVKVYYK
jgi:hypothetical protein